MLKLTIDSRDLHKMIPRWEEFKEKILDAPLLNYLEHLRAMEDAEKQIKLDLAGILIFIIY